MDGCRRGVDIKEHHSLACHLFVLPVFSLAQHIINILLYHDIELDHEEMKRGNNKK